MTFIEVLLNILAIIAIVGIGGFVIYYLGGVLLNVLESKNKSHNQDEQPSKDFSQEKQPTQFMAVEYQPKQDAEQSYEDTLSDEKFMLDDDEKVESVDYSKATAEKKSLNNQPVEEKIVAPVEANNEDSVNNIFGEDKEFNFEDFDFDAFFNEQNNQAEQAVQAEPQEAVEEEIASEPAVVETAQDFASFDAEPVKTVAESAVNVSVVASSNVEQTTNVEHNTETEVQKTVYVQNTELEESLRAEIAELKAELAEQKALYEALKAQADDNQKKWEEEKTTLEQLYADAEKREQESNAKTKETLSIEEYEARLKVLEERLRANEAELRANRKEFMPLKRVRKNLDKDKSKLRRREALVAKQKVLLYGVNNITEINQEKAKKLAEDLDLLDGLKVSVRHCEEVMEANKERYPVLETANRILVTINEEIKADIIECIRAIKKLKGEEVDEGAELLRVIGTDPTQPKRKRGRPRKEKTDETETKAQEENVQLQNVSVADVLNTLEEDQTIIHSAQTENVAEEESIDTAKIAELLDQVEVSELDVIEMAEVEGQNEEVELPVVENAEVVPASAETQVVENQPQTTTKVAVTKQEKVTKTTLKAVQTNQETAQHKFDFDAEEPSMEDLFAIENEALFDFGNHDDNK